MHIKFNVVRDAIKLTPVLTFWKKSSYILCDIIIVVVKSWTGTEVQLIHNNIALRLNCTKIKIYIYIYLYIQS